MGVTRSLVALVTHFAVLVAVGPEPFVLSVYLFLYYCCFLFLVKPFVLSVFVFFCANCEYKNGAQTVCMIFFVLLMMVAVPFWRRSHSSCVPVEGSTGTQLEVEKGTP